MKHFHHLRSTVQICSNKGLFTQDTESIPFFFFFSTKFLDLFIFESQNNYGLILGFLALNLPSSDNYNLQFLTSQSSLKAANFLQCSLRTFGSFSKQRLSQRERKKELLQTHNLLPLPRLQIDGCQSHEEKKLSLKNGA